MQSIYKRIAHYTLPFFLLGSVMLNGYFIYQNNRNPVKKGLDFAVSRVIDGDTFDVKSGERIRLYAIDAPEYPSGCLSSESRARLNDLILDNNVNIYKITTDNFGRIVALVYVKEQLINKVMVEEGFAYFSDQKQKTKEILEIEKAQNTAKELRRNIWSDLCVTKKDGCVIKGNYRSADNTRIYHLPSCYNYDKITIKPNTTDRWFCSEEEATKAGFIKSKDCPR